MKKIQHSGLTLETEKDSERRQEKSAQQREAVNHQQLPPLPSPDYTMEGIRD